MKWGCSLYTRSLNIVVYCFCVCVNHKFVHAVTHHLFMWTEVQNNLVNILIVFFCFFVHRLSCQIVIFWREFTIMYLEMIFLPFPFLSSMYLIDNSVWSRFIHDNIIKMETFSVLLAVCEGNSLVTSKFPSQRPVTWSFNGFFDLCLKKRLSKQVTRWWSQMPPRWLWHHSNGPVIQHD